MNKTYDPQYNTQPNFNSPVVEDIVYRKDIMKINHWIENGEPHKRLAEVAFYASLNTDWMEGIEVIWNSGWCANKGLITKAWNYIVSAGFTENQFNNSIVCKWLFEKTFKEDFLSKSELNNLGVSILDLANYHNNSYVWNMFFSIGLELKGKKAEKLFWDLCYFRYFNEANVNNTDQIKYSQEERDAYQKRINEVLNNGIQISYKDIMSYLLKGYNDLFWEIIESKFIMNPKDLTILLTLLSIYFRLFSIHVQKEKKEFIDLKLEKILKSFIEKGLTEKVTLTIKEIKEDYNFLVEHHQGYISLKIFPDFGYLGDYSAYQLNYIEYSKYHPKRTIVDVEIYSGDAFFAEPIDKRGKGYFDDISFVELTNEQKLEYREKMRLKIKEYK